MSTFTYSHTYGVNETKNPRVLKAQFGDGYQQRTADGINTIVRQWNLTFINTTANIADIDSFLTTAGGVDSFDWTPPHGSAGKFICEAWTRGKDSYGLDSLTATFIEVFGE